MSRHSVSVDVDIDEFDDEAIVDQVIARNLVADVLRAQAGKSEDDEKPEKTIEPVETILADAQEHLIGRRADKARDALRRAIAQFVPAAIVEAIDHIDAGRLNAAICEIERFCHPSPAATATTYPKTAPPVVTQ